MLKTADERLKLIKDALEKIPAGTIQGLESEIKGLCRFHKRKYRKGSCRIIWTKNIWPGIVISSKIFPDFVPIIIVHFADNAPCKVNEAPIKITYCWEEGELIAKNLAHILTKNFKIRKENIETGKDFSHRGE